MADKKNDINDILKKMKNVTVESSQDGSNISFAGQGLKLDKKEDAKVIVDAITAVGVLSSLNLEGNTLGVNAAKAIADALSKHAHFKRALWKDMFTGRMKTEIPDALRYLGTGLQTAGARLVELDLSDNAFGPIGVEGLADLLRSPCCFALQELKLNNNGLGITGCKLLSKALHDCYDKSKAEGAPLALRVFIAGRNRLENEGAKLLAEVFKKLKSLERVEMPQNGIYHVGMSALSEAFKLNPNLSHLNLNDNTVTARGAGPLGAALEVLPGLTSLNLGDCLLKSAGAGTLAKFLAGNTTLEELNVTCNEIGLEGGLELARAMKNKPHLRSINLSENQFGEEGVEEVVKLMTAYGMGGALLLEDDEGEASDEENGDDDEEEEEESDSSDQDETNSDAEGNVSNSAQDEIVKSLEATVLTSPNASKATVRTSSVSDVQNSVSKFLRSSSPSLAMFNALGPNSTQAFIEEVNSEPEDRYLDSMLLAIMKVSSLLPPDASPSPSSASPSSSPSSSSSPSPVLPCVQALYRELFAWASASDKLPTVTNSLLVHLGLIKSEDKAFRCAYKLAGCMAGVRLAAAAKLLPSQTEGQLWTCVRMREKREKEAGGEVPVLDCY